MVVLYGFALEVVVGVVFDVVIKRIVYGVYSSSLERLLRPFPARCWPETFMKRLLEGADEEVV